MVVLLTAHFVSIPREMPTIPHTWHRLPLQPTRTGTEKQERRLQKWESHLSQNAESWWIHFISTIKAIQGAIHGNCDPLSLTLSLALVGYSSSYSNRKKGKGSKPALIDHLACPTFPGGSEAARSAGNPGLIPGLGKSPGEGNGNPLQYPCLENSTDRGAWLATAHGVTKSLTRLSDWAPWTNWTLL